MQCVHAWFHQNATVIKMLSKRSPWQVLPPWAGARVRAAFARWVNTDATRARVPTPGETMCVQATVGFQAARRSHATNVHVSGAACACRRVTRHGATTPAGKLVFQPALFCPCFEYVQYGIVMFSACVVPSRKKCQRSAKCFKKCACICMSHN